MAKDLEDSKTFSKKVLCATTIEIIKPSYILKW